MSLAIVCALNLPLCRFSRFPKTNNILHYEIINCKANQKTKWTRIKQLNVPAIWYIIIVELVNVERPQTPVFVFHYDKCFVIIILKKNIWIENWVFKWGLVMYKICNSDIDNNLYLFVLVIVILLLINKTWITVYILFEII